jgi:hypothetical protein
VSALKTNNYIITQMKKFQTLLIACIAICFTLNLYGQVKSSFHIGPSIPVLDFGSDDINNTEASGAATGFNFGADFRIPLGPTGVGVFGGIDVHYNSLEDDYEDDVEEALAGMTTGDIDATFQKYVNIPLAIGVDFEHELVKPLKIFARAGVVYNTLIITPTELEYEGNTLVSMTYDPAGSTGLKIGGGVLISDKVSFALDYYGLGEHTVDAHMSDPYNETDVEVETSVNIITLTLGVRF